MHRVVSTTGIELSKTAGRTGASSRLRVPIAWLQLGVLFSALMALAFARRVDNDFWWHLRTGDLIVHSGILRHDPYSWSAAGKAWVAHEWLSEVVIYSIQSTLGYGANVLLFGAVAVSSLAIAYSLGRRLKAQPRALVVILLLAVCVIGPFVTVRPQVFSWLFFVLFLTILARDYEGERMPIWLLPPLTALWANVHLGFHFGLLLIGCWLAAHALDAARGRRSSLGPRALLGVACVLAACANPNGPELLLYPLRYIFASDIARATVNEWQRPSIASPVQMPIFLAALLLVLALCSRSRPRPFLFFVSIAVLGLAMQATRNAPFLALVLVPVGGVALSDRWSRTGDEATVGIGAAALAAAMPLALAMLIFSATGGSLVKPSEAGYPSESASYVASHLNGRRLFNDYNSGGYLIEKHPDVPVFIDGRTDFYGNALLADYVRIRHAELGWDQLLNDYGAGIVLVPESAPLASALLQSPSWRLTFRAEGHMVFERR